MLLMSLRRGGVGLSDPIQHASQEKAGQSPCAGQRLPWIPLTLRHEISGESTESVCLRKCVRPRVCVCVCGIKELLCHRYCLGPSLAFSRGAGAREGDGAFI